MGNVDKGKNLKTLPIMVINIWVNILPIPPTQLVVNDDDDDDILGL